MKTSNNTILITGGTSGIGWALATALKSLNNTVILLGRNKAKLATAQNDGFETIACDLSDPSQIEAASVLLQNQYPNLNVLFNNAGIQQNYLFAECVVPMERMMEEVTINLTGQMALTQLLLPQLMQQERAFIVNTTSGLGAFPKSDGIVYSASKAGMRSFNLGLRYALKNTPIKVMEFIPPVTATAMTQQRNEDKMSPDNLVAYILPQLKKEKKVVTVPKMRLFLKVAKYFPGLAHKILSK